jgi:hypothetical protein
MRRLCREASCAYPGTERSGDGQPFEGFPVGVSETKQILSAVKGGQEVSRDHSSVQTSRGR